MRARTGCAWGYFRPVLLAEQLHRGHRAGLPGGRVHRMYRASLPYPCRNHESCSKACAWGMPRIDGASRMLPSQKKLRACALLIEMSRGELAYPSSRHARLADVDRILMRMDCSSGRNRRQRCGGGAIRPAYPCNICESGGDRRVSAVRNRGRQRGVNL